MLDTTSLSTCSTWLYLTYPAIDPTCCSLPQLSCTKCVNRCFFIPEKDFRATLPAFNTWATYHNPNKQLTFMKSVVLFGKIIQVGKVAFTMKNLARKIN